MKKNQLVVFISTSQSPHIEAMIKYAYDFSNSYKNVYVVDLLPSTRYRHELSYRSYLPIRLNLSRLLRNGINKKIFLLSEKRKGLLNYVNYSELPLKKIAVSDEDIYKIIKTYSSTEWKAPALRINKYTSRIRSNIVSISRRIPSLISELNLDDDCDFLVFNGRLPVENTVVTSLENLGYLNFIYHECNNYQNKVFFTRNRIHNMSGYYEEICQYYEKYQGELLDSYFEHMGLLDHPRKLNNRIITYFTNSSDEFQFAYRKPTNQAKIVSSLLCADFPGFVLKIRVHPGTKNKSKESKRYWNRLKNLHPDVIINYDENMSSYDLCRDSKVTISMGSSMAAESLILRTPHILIGEQNWHHRFPGYISCGEDNVIETIKDFLRDDPDKSNVISDKERRLAAASIFFRFKKGERIKCAPLGKFPVVEIPLDRIK